MGASITFDVDKLIRKLDIIQKSHLPKVSEETPNSLAAVGVGFHCIGIQGRSLNRIGLV